jgi:carbonic anhydrase
MRKLVNGVVEFRKTLTQEHRDAFAKVALEQRPDTLFVACSDSRMAPNIFASTDPGDVFVIRNVGNIIPSCCDPSSEACHPLAESAAIEFALTALSVSDIIICGHSNCGAMAALYGGRHAIRMPSLSAWLQHADSSLDELRLRGPLDPSLTPINQLSQIHVLKQREHLMSYPQIRERVSSGSLRLHAWWFHIDQACVQAYDESLKKFVELDEAHAEKLLQSATAATHPKAPHSCP